jgi:hypothetical protein
MEGRGWFTTVAVGLVLAIGGLALVDSVRGCETTTTTVTPAPATTQAEAPTTTSVDTGPKPQEDAPPDWPQGELDGVLTFVDSEDCRVRTIGLSSGRERPPSRFVTDCRGFWAPKVGSRIAFGDVLLEGFFRIADLGHPRRDFGPYPIGASTAPIWSADGGRIAWCDSPDTGIEREILGQGTILDFCPVAYAPNGELAYAEDSNLVLDGRILLTTEGFSIEWAQLGSNRTALVLTGGRVERYAGSRRTASVSLTERWTGGAPVGSPDTCYVAFPTDIGFRVEPLCIDGPFLEAPVHAVSWSPDGRWLAMAAEGGLAFVRVGRSFSGFTTWPAKAVQLQWRG